MRQSNLFIVTTLMMFCMTNASAAIYKGRISYSENCRACHNWNEGVTTSKTKEEWEEVMKNKGLGLAKVHTSSKNCSGAWAYFKSATYKKQSRHLQDFFVEYAKNSGNVLAVE